MLSQVIMARSLYLEAKVNRWCQEEKKELVIDDCDPDTFNIIVDYMYGSPIPGNVVTSAFDKTFVPKEDYKNSLSIIKKYFSGKLERLTKLLRMSDMMQMVDLKCEVEKLLIKFLDDTWFKSKYIYLNQAVLVLIDPAVLFNCKKLLLTCARKWRTCSIVLDLDRAESVIKTRPKFAAALLAVYTEQNV